MTRLFITLLGLFLIISCNQTKTKSANEIDKYDFTNLGVSDSLKLPKGFQIDSTLKFDASRNTEIQIIVPKYINSTNFNSAVSSYIAKRLTDFITSLDTLLQEDHSMLLSSPSSFIVNPVSVYKNNKVLSYCFIISSVHAGAAHPLTKYYSFNYDLSKEIKINFYDYFNIKSKHDTAFLKHIINKAINRSNIGIDKLYDIDFNIEPDSIAFNFDDYEIASYAEGIIKAKVAKRDIPKIIMNNYR